MNRKKAFILFFLALLVLAISLIGKEGRHVDVQSQHTNRLIDEASPYLQQHAHNPVDWFPWGDEAFEKAKQENKPVFLSIGYSTCHWCHVMAHESFENETIAAVLNKYFVSIKVDREERPDVDSVYMEFVQKTTGSGGWPTTVFLTPNGKPFYGGTYYPPTDMYGRPGFESLLSSIEDAWQNNRDKLVETADRITGMLQDQAQKADTLVLNDDDLHRAFRTLERLYDEKYGGFGNAPKFPQPSMLSFLLTYAVRTQDNTALEMVENTLSKMSQGGIYDHLGGGFHRYSVDEKWLVPHFEKMLYDQALISRSLIQAWQVSQNPEFMKTARDIFEYVLRDMTSPKGGFYSAEDADSEGSEGTFYIWTPEGVDKVLNAEEQQLFKAYYGVTKEGNFEHGTSILNVTQPLSEIARQHDMDVHQARKTLVNARQKLFGARSERIRPHRDEKIIAGWNGLMISSLAYGGGVFNEPRYIQAAQNSTDFAITNLYKGGRLMRYYGRDRANEYGVLEDYAYFIQGLIDLYQADFNPHWLQTAVELTEQMIELFNNKEIGGFYMTGRDAEKLIFRNRPDYDGALPSGNSVAAAALIRLSELTGNKQFLQYAHDTLTSFQDALKQHPTSLSEMLIATDLWLGPRSEIIIATDSLEPGTGRFFDVYRNQFLPRSVLLFRGPKTDISLLEKVSEVARDKNTLDGKPTVYLCENFVCLKPLTDPDSFSQAIKSLQK